jgi:hypothetical protein
MSGSDEDVVSPDESFWVGLVLAQELGSDLENLDLALDLADALARLLELSTLDCRTACDVAVVDAILTHPVTEALGTDAET